MAVNPLIFGFLNFRLMFALPVQFLPALRTSVVRRHDDIGSHFSTISGLLSALVLTIHPQNFNNQPLASGSAEQSLAQTSHS